MTKNILFAMIAAAFWLTTPPAPAAAQENKTPNGRIITAPVAVSDALEKRLTIRMRGATLSDLLNYISRETGLTFSIADNLAKTQITVYLKDGTVNELLELLIKGKDLSVRRSASGKNFQISKSTAPFAGFPPLTRKDIEDPLLQRVTDKIRLKNAPLTVFLDIVSEQAKVNFIIPDSTKNILITTEQAQTTIADVLLFLKGKGLSYSRIGRTNTFVIRAIEHPSDTFSEAEKAFEEARYETAIGLYKEVLEKFPDSEMADSALLMIAVNYDWIAARDNDSSAVKEEEKFLNSLINEYPKSTRLGDAYLYLGQIYSGLSGAKAGAVDCIKAIKYYKLAIQSTYRGWIKAQAMGRMAQCYERNGENGKAAGLYSEILEKYPDTAFAKELKKTAKPRYPMLETVGRTLEGQGEYKLAMDVYRRAVEKETSAESVRSAELRIGICQAALEDTEGAMKTFAAYIAKYRPEPEDEAYLQMGQALEKAGRPDDAKAYLEKAGAAGKP